METTVNRIDNDTVELSFTIPQEEVDKALSKTYQSIASKQNIKGFRKGKVPRDVIRQMLGFDQVAMMALDEILPRFYMQACDEKDIFPVGQPEFDPWPELKEKEALDVKIKVKALPDFTVADYSEIPVEFDGSVNVSDEEIDKAVENIKKSVAEYAPLIEDRGAVVSDQVKINYVAYEVQDDGKEQKTEKRDGATVKLGTGGTLPEIEENIMGMKVGDKKTFTIDFPEKYQRPELAGKKAKYDVEMVEINRAVPIESDEELLEKLGEEIKDMDTLKGDIRTSISQQKAETRDRQVTMGVLAHVVEGTKLEVPQELIDEEMDRRFSDLENILQSRDRTLEDYAAEMGTTVDKMKEEELVEARFAVKRRIVLNRIYSTEEMEILPHELERAIISFAMENRMNQAEVKKLARNEGFVSDLRQRLRESKVMALLKGKVKYPDAGNEAAGEDVKEEAAPEANAGEKESGEE